jgi:hypothetical protein
LRRIRANAFMNSDEVSAIETREVHEDCVQDLYRKLAHRHRRSLEKLGWFSF